MRFRTSKAMYALASCGMLYLVFRLLLVLGQLTGPVLSLYFRDNWALGYVTPEGYLEVLPDSRRDVQYFGLAVDNSTDTLLWATSRGIEKVNLDGTNRTKIIGGWLDITVSGYNLGGEIEDVTMLAFRGVPCASLNYINSNSLSCRTSDPVLTDPDVQLQLDDVAVHTVQGGWINGPYPGDFFETQIADNSMEPIILDLNMNTRPERPHALAVDWEEQLVYWSNLAMGTIERASTNGSNLQVVVSDAGQVYGMAMDQPVGQLYYADSKRGVVVRARMRETPAGGEAPQEVVLRDLRMPMGIALEATRHLLYVTEYNGAICKADMSGANLQQNPSLPPRYLQRVITTPTSERLDGVAIRSREPVGLGHTEAEVEVLDDPTVPALYWAESGGNHTIKQSTRTGTNTTVILMRQDGVDLMWPRSLALDAEQETLYITEFFGRIQRLQIYPNISAPEVLVQETNPTSAAAQRRLRAIDGNPTARPLFLDVPS